MINETEKALQELVKAVRASEEYTRYQDTRNRLHQLPELEARVNAFRKESYRLQSGDGVLDLYEETDRMEREYCALCENPIASEFLAWENSLCRLVQKVNWTLIESLDFELGFED
ncbi:MAG: YlbF family regulator [Clostridiales bacterium]|nr:YlbF family regulator [Clostridiales bacterium]